VDVTDCKSYYLEGCKGIVLSNSMNNVYIRIEKIDHNDQVIWTFNAFNVGDINVEILSTPDNQSYHDISCKENVPVRLCFDSEAVLSTSYKPNIGLDIPDQIFHFDRFSELLMKISNDLLKELHLFESDDIEWIVCDASDPISNKLSKHLYLHGSESNPVYFRCIDDVKLFVQIIQNRLVEHWMDESAYEEPRVFYEWMMYNLETILDDKIYETKHSLRAYGSKSIKQKSDIGNKLRQMLPKDKQLKKQDFFKCLTQAYDPHKIGTIIAFEGYTNMILKRAVDLKRKLYGGKSNSVKTTVQRQRKPKAMTALQKDAVVKTVCKADIALKEEFVHVVNSCLQSHGFPRSVLTKKDLIECDKNNM
jgi:hypothetical protein